MLGRHALSEAPLSTEPGAAAPVVVPDFFAAYAPSRLVGFPLQHTKAFAAPPFETLPAPDFGQRALFPDWFPPRYPQHPAFHDPPHFETLPAPDFGNRAFFPDRLARARALTEYPQPAFAPTLVEEPELSWEPWYVDSFPPRYPRHEPFGAPPVFEVLPAPDFGQRAIFPDRLARAVALSFYPQPVMNLDPIPNAAVVEFFAAYWPDLLLPHRPRPPGFFALVNFETLPAPDFGQRAVFPDRLARARALSPYPQPVMNLDPIPPELSWKGVYPDRLFRLYPEHIFAFVPPPTVQTVAPTFFAWYGPDRLYRLYPQHPAFHEPPHFETLPAPDYSWRAYFQDRLERIRALWPYPQPVMNIEPIAAPAPDFGNRAFFPDRLELIRALWPYPQPVMNLDPIPNPVPDFIQAIMPDRLYGFKPAPFPFKFDSPTPEAFLVLDDSSRGLYQGLRGLYENLESAHCEPYAIALSQGQIIPGSSVTDVDLTSVPFTGGSIFTGVDGDPWGLVDLVNNRIVIKHNGYYIISAVGEWANNSTGLRQVTVFAEGSGVGGQVLRLTYPASNFSGFSAVSPVFAVDRRRRVYARVQQQSGGDLELLTLYLSVVRVARPRHVLPI